MKDEIMMKGYFVPVPPTLAEVLADIGGKTEADDFDEIVNAAFQSFFSFYTPRWISNSLAQDLEKFVLNHFIMRRIGSGNARKWKQIFKNEWNRIIPYYERLLETQENENNYFTNPITNVNMKRGEDAEGTRNTDTDRDRTTGLTHTGSGSHTTDETNSKTHTGSGSHTTDETTGKTHQGSGSHTTDETNSKTHSGSFSENTSSSEINRFSDTPQGDSSDIWETDAQGHAVLTDIYLTDIRGITDSGTRTGSDQSTETGSIDRDEAMTDSYTDSGTLDREEAMTDTFTENGTIDRDEATTETYTDAGTESEEIGVDETTTSSKTSDELGYNGKSPVELLQIYRDSFMKIYTDIVGELDPVFYNLVEVDDLIDFV